MKAIGIKEQKKLGEWLGFISEALIADIKIAEQDETPWEALRKMKGIAASLEKQAQKLIGEAFNINTNGRG